MNIDLSNIIAKAQDTVQEIVEKSVTNLRTQGKNSSYNLSRSIKGGVTSDKDGVQMHFFMESYGVDVDMGRDGTEYKQRNPNSVFYQGANNGRFPPPQAIKQWIAIKPINPIGDASITPESLAYLIGRKIEKRGITSSLFFTDAYNQVAQAMSEELALEVSKSVTNEITKSITKTI